MRRKGISMVELTTAIACFSALAASVALGSAREARNAEFCVEAEQARHLCAGLLERFRVFPPAAGPERTVPVAPDEIGRGLYDLRTSVECTVEPPGDLRRVRVRVRWRAATGDLVERSCSTLVLPAEGE